VNVKIFNNNNVGYLQNAINDFLRTNLIEIIHIFQTTCHSTNESGLNVTVSIWYKYIR
jgi:hypothetical protein